jgi:protein ImuB
VFGALHVPGSLPRGDLLQEVARAFTPRVELAEPDLVLLDLDGMGRLWPSMESLGEALLEASRGRGLLDPRVALAWTRVAARLLARARPSLTLVPAGGEPAALAELPLTHLGLPEDRLHLFQRWGLRTLGDVARLPAVGLAERLGPDGPRLRRLARGEDETPLVPTPPPESFEATLEVDWPVEGIEPLSFLLSRVLESLCKGLRARGRQAAALTLFLSLADGRHHRRTLSPAAPSVEARTWRTLLLLDLEASPPGEAVLALTVRAEPTPAREVQLSLIDPALPSPEKLLSTMARLHDWTAEGRAGAITILDTHRPGGFVLGTFAPGVLTRPRLRLPLWPRVAMRAFRPPLSAQVRLERGEPAHLTAPGLAGPVHDRAGPWRASGDWWDVAWSREEWDVALDGGVYRIFRDRMRGEWFVEGELD